MPGRMPAVAAELIGATERTQHRARRIGGAADADLHDLRRVGRHAEASEWQRFEARDRDPPFDVPAPDVRKRDGGASTRRPAATALHHSSAVKPRPCCEVVAYKVRHDVVERVMVVARVAGSGCLSMKPGDRTF